MRARFVIIAFLLASCSESFAPASAVTEFRIVAAKVELGNDPARANPSPEDPLQVSLLAIDQGAPPTPEPSLTPGPLQWALVPCVPIPVTIGTPLCGPEIRPCEGCVEIPPADVLALPVARLTAPTMEELEQAQASSVLLQGVVCSNGVPSADAIQRFIMGETDQLVPCEGPPTIPGRPIEGRFIASTIPIEPDPTDPNLNPEVRNVLLNGRPWPPPYDQSVPRDAPRTGCAVTLEGLTPEERARHPRAGDQASTIELSVTQESLQTYVVEDRELVEEIQVSWLADGGGFEANFGFIIDTARSVLTQWQPSAEVPTDGELVRFTFVIRDGRGGTDWVERALCITPPSPE